MTRRLRYRVVPDAKVRGGAIALDGDATLADETHWCVGRLAEQGRRRSVTWSFQEEAVVGIFGRRGSGKSYTLGALLEALAATGGIDDVGGNAGDRGALLFDTLNIFEHTAVAAHKVPDDELREEAVKNLRSFGMDTVETDRLNIDMIYPAGELRSFYPDNYDSFALDTTILEPEDYGHIFDIDIYRDAMGHLLTAAYERINDSSYSLPGNEEIEPSNGLAGLIKCVEEDGSLDQQFATDSRRALTARLRALHQKPVFSDDATAIGSLIPSDGVGVLLLAHLSPELRSVVAALIVRQLFQARATAAEASKALRLDPDMSEQREKRAREVISRAPPRTVLCFDEAQGYAPPRMSNPCTAALTQYVKEGRNYGLSLVLTTQQPSAIHDNILSQVDGILSHRLTVPKDINAALSNAKARSPERIVSEGSTLDEKDLLRELAVGQAWLSHGDANRCMVVDIRPRITAHGGIES